MQLSKKSIKSQQFTGSLTHFNMGVKPEKPDHVPTSQCHPVLELIASEISLTKIILRSLEERIWLVMVHTGRAFDP